MKKDDVSRAIKEIDMGIIPYELTFGLEKVDKIDWTALVYNEWDYIDYWMAKLPEGLIDQWPCLEQYYKEHFENMPKLTPLQELELRKMENVKIE